SEQLAAGLRCRPPAPGGEKPERDGDHTAAGHRSHWTLRVICRALAISDDEPSSAPHASIAALTFWRGSSESAASTERSNGWGIASVAARAAASCALTLASSAGATALTSSEIEGPAWSW